jgi:flagellar biosynthetic protein FlhB
MADTDQERTEAPTPKRKKDAAEKGDVLQSRELGTALVVLSGALWLAFAGPMMMNALQVMLTDGLSFDAADLRNFDPGSVIVRLLWIVAPPLLGLFLVTMVAAIGAPAMLGSLGFRPAAIAFRGSKLNPINGFKRIFGVQGLVELAKSIAKVLLLGSIGIWLLMSQSRSLIGLSSNEIHAAIADVGITFMIAVIVMAAGLAGIALTDVPVQYLRRIKRLRMTREEVKEEHKQTDGSPEVKAQLRRRQREIALASVRSAMAEATVVLTNPTHFAVALRYKPGQDPAPIVVARGCDVTAEAIRELAAEHEVPVLSYPQLTRAIYFTSRVGQVIREDLYLAVATVLAFVFNLETALRNGTPPPAVEVPAGVRFDANGRPEAAAP